MLTKIFGEPKTGDENIGVTERLSKLPEVTELLCGEAQIQIQTNLREAET